MTAPLDPNWLFEFLKLFECDTYMDVCKETS